MPVTWSIGHARVGSDGVSATDRAPAVEEGKVLAKRYLSAS